MGIRTPDLLHAMQALYQLSYSPSGAPGPPAAAPRQCTRKLASPCLPVSVARGYSAAPPGAAPATSSGPGGSDHDPRPNAPPDLALAREASRHCAPTAATGRTDGRERTMNNWPATRASVLVPAARECGTC